MDSSKETLDDLLRNDEEENQGHGGKHWVGRGLETGIITVI